VAGVEGLAPYWLTMITLLVTVKFVLGVGINPRKVKNPNSLLNPYKLMCNILLLVLI